MDLAKKPWECNDEMEKIISLNQYSEDADVLKKTIQEESILNIKSAAMILFLKLKPMNTDDLMKFLIGECGLSIDESIELLNYTIDVLEKL